MDMNTAELNLGTTCDVTSVVLQLDGKVFQMTPNEARAIAFSLEDMANKVERALGSHI